MKSSRRTFMLSFYNQYARNIHSQNGEDGILAECASRMGFEGWREISENYSDDLARRLGHCVEIGANDGYWMSNARLLIEHGWSALFVEGSYDLYLQCKANWSHNPRVRSQCCYVDGNNINAFVDETCDVLSLDTDGSDYAIFKGLKARPKIVIVEIDSSIEPPSERVNVDGGVGYQTMVQLALNRGYFLLAHTGNLIFVRDEYTNLFAEVWGKHPLKQWEQYFNRGWL